MKLNIIQVFSILFVFQIVINLLFVFNINYYLIRTVFSFVSLLFLPGFFLIMCLRIYKINIFEHFSYIIGLSLSFLIFTGLFINFVFPKLGIIQPLSDLPVYFGFNLMLLIVGILAYVRSAYFQIEIKFPKITLLNLILILIPLLILGLSVFGAITLNNNSTNLYAIAMIIIVALYVFIVTIFRNRIDGKLYPLIIYFLGIALLLSYSLRSWHILGWDINMEYQMFQLTKIKSLWAVSNSASNFNSCLSVTILPTILNSFLHINDEYIFKVIFQLIFVIAPINIYLITKKYTDSLLAFFCAFFFISQEVFYMGLSAITRQEIAFVFFTCMVLILFNKNIRSGTKNILFLIFGISMVVSHYSTTYVALVLFFLTYLAVFIIRHFKKNLLNSYQLRLTSISVLFLAAIFWNIQVTKSFNYVLYTFGAVVRNIGNTFTFNDKNATIFSFLFNSKNIYTNVQLDKFIEDYTYQYLKLNKVDPIMKGEITNTDKLHFIDDTGVVSQKTLWNKFSIFPYTIAKYLILLSLVIGLLNLVINKIKNNSRQDLEYLFLSLISISLILLMIVLPHISVAYNINRFFLQSLIFFPICIVIGMMILFKRLHNLRFYLIPLIFIIYYLYQSGITASITGNALRINTYNVGMEYDAHYIKDEDISAIEWMAQRYQNYEYIYMDSMAIPKFKSFAVRDINKIQYVIPNIIDKSNYVYAGYSNTHKNIAFIEDEFYSSGSLLTINYPFEFLNDNKNLIYNNGGARFYR